VFFLHLDGLNHEFVHTPHDRGIAQAVAQDGLPVSDGGNIAETAEHREPGYLQQKRVARRHRIQQHLQSEVLDQLRRLCREGCRELEVAIAVHQEGLHDASRSRIDR
jgi:hypothetical protein